MGTWFSRRGRAVNWIGLAVLLAILVAWQLLITLGVVSSAALPSPAQIWHGVGDLTGPDGGLWPAVGHTIGIVLLAWVVGAGVGGLLGMLLALNETVASWAYATVDLLRSLPVVALIPIGILIWGTGDATEVILGAYAALWPMLINTAGGVRGIAPRLRDVAATLRLSRLTTLRKIVLPATGAPMLIGARLSLATALVVCVVSEMLGLQSGVGNQLVLEQSGMQPARMWVYVLLVGVLGILVNAGLVGAFRVAFPGIAAVAERSGR
jgi:sulfonate transport system permease protein